jgi:hypothetical protein
LLSFASLEVYFASFLLLFALFASAHLAHSTTEAIEEIVKSKVILGTIIPANSNLGQLLLSSYALYNKYDEQLCDPANKDFGLILIFYYSDIASEMISEGTQLPSKYQSWPTHFLLYLL